MNIETFYTEYGKGRPLIMLHGNSESGEYFKHQIEEFSDRFRVICPDTRGHGRTERGTAPFTIEQFAEDLNVFMNRLGIERADILGFSDGGNIALCFALRYPQKVNKLVLDGANLYPSGLRARIRVPVTFSYVWYGVLSKFNHAYSSKAQMMALMAADPHINPRDLSGIRAQTLVIAGSDDLIKRSHTELIHSSIPGSELRIIEGDHFIAYRRPKEFNSVVLDFLDDSTEHMGNND